MVWFLAITGIALLAVGLWGGQGRRRAKQEQEAKAQAQPTVKEAWDILSRPLEIDELFPAAPERRSWGPGKDRTFSHGLLVGVGSGLLIAALVAFTLPRPAPGPSPAAQAPKEQAPAAPAPGTAPAAPAPAPAPTPSNVTVTIDSGDLAPDIARKLREAKVIASEFEFLDRVAERGVDTRLRSGSFIVPVPATVDQVIDALIS